MLFLIFNMHYATWLFPRAGDSFVAQPDHLPKTYGYDIWMDWPYIKIKKNKKKPKSFAPPNYALNQPVNSVEQPIMIFC